MKTTNPSPLLPAWTACPKCGAICSQSWRCPCRRPAPDEMPLTRGEWWLIWGSVALWYGLVAVGLAGMGWALWGGR